MKAGEKFAINAVWWKANKPKTLTRDGVTAALDTFIRANAAITGQSPEDKNIEKLTAWRKAIEALKKGVSDTMKACLPTQKETKDCLQAALANGGAIPAAEKALLDIYQKKFEAIAVRAKKFNDRSHASFEALKVAVAAATPLLAENADVKHDPLKTLIKAINSHADQLNQSQAFGSEGHAFRKSAEALITHPVCKASATKLITEIVRGDELETQTNNFVNAAHPVVKKILEAPQA